LSCLSLFTFNTCSTVDRRCALSLLRFLSISDTLLGDGAVPSGSLLELDRITAYMSFEFAIDLLVMLEVVRKHFLKTTFRDERVILVLNRDFKMVLEGLQIIFAEVRAEKVEDQR
jgi:hypothetical protein